jgi:hypothetical protein
VTSTRWATETRSASAIEGSGVAPLPGQGRPIKAGEFILGYPGEAGIPVPAPRPNVLGRNGTLVGLRKYQSRVGAFNRFLGGHAQTEEERKLLAAKLVGRWRSGAPLTLAPERDDPDLGADAVRNNDFTYAADPRGRQVPLGSHMRRMNPRDTEMAVLADVNLHRIIRRSTTFGAPYDPEALSAAADEVPRGLYFIFIGAKAMATLEFLQQDWINNGNFMRLDEERDPHRRPSGERRHVHDPAVARPPAHSRHRDLQRAARRRVLLPALAERAALAREWNRHGGALTDAVLVKQAHGESRLRYGRCPRVPRPRAPAPASAASSCRRGASPGRRGAECGIDAEQPAHPSGITTREGRAVPKRGYEV